MVGEVGVGGTSMNPPPHPGSSPGALVFVAFQYFHILCTEVFEIWNVGACAFECDSMYMLKGLSACILNKFFL